MAAVESTVGGSGWRGALALRFAASGARTFVANRRHEGPFCIQQPFYPGDGACHVYLLHPPGGLAAGDELVLDAAVERGAASLLTTPASTKFYRSDGAPSVQTQTLRVAAGGSLEWLPLDTILFGGSRAAITTDVHLHGGSTFIGWEMTALGRPLSGDRYASGSLEQRTQIRLDGAPLLLERLRWQATDELLRAPWGLAGFDVLGALYAYPCDTALLARARELLGAAVPSIDEMHSAAASERSVRARQRRCGVTLLGNLLVVRCLERRPEALRTTFEALWAELRQPALGRKPSAPRIWKT